MVLCLSITGFTMALWLLWDFNPQATGQPLKHHCTWIRRWESTSSTPNLLNNNRHGFFFNYQAYMMCPPNKCVKCYYRNKNILDILELQQHVYQSCWINTVRPIGIKNLQSAVCNIKLCIAGGKCTFLWTFVLSWQSSPKTPPKIFFKNEILL